MSQSRCQKKATDFLSLHLVLQEADQEPLKPLKVELVVLPDPFLPQHVLEEFRVVRHVELLDARLVVC